MLVHGLWMRHQIFFCLGRRLARRGFAVRAFDYPSVRRGLDDNAAALAAVVRDPGGRPPPHLIGHSLGGLVILRMLALHPQLAVGRVVLLGVPVRGSQAASTLRRFAPMAALIGRTVADWQALPPPDRPPRVETGVIAGDRGIGIAALLPAVARPHDGVVAVDETILPGAHAHLVLHRNHSELLFARDCADAVAGFLVRGSFSGAVTAGRH